MPPLRSGALWVTLFCLWLWSEHANGNTSTCDAPNSSSSSKLVNTAFVFVKPQANTPSTRELVHDRLTQAGITVLLEKDIGGVEIDERGLIDQHYFAIASKATLLSVTDIPVPPDRFEDAFGESWDRVLEEGRACNAMEACQRFDCTPSELNEAWQGVEAVKFGGGFYCGRLSVHGKPELYVFNAFFMAMRSKFVGENNSIHCYVVEWDPAILSWSEFRRDLLGSTDPSEAPQGSIRRTILDQYKELGLSSKPNKGDNGVHASASPFEGLAERNNWLGDTMDQDSFGKAMLQAGIPESQAVRWFKDPQVYIKESTKGSIFDTLEDMDADECLEKIVELNLLN